MKNKGYAFFIFGGSGDLARKKIYPVLRKLYKEGELSNLRGIYALARDENGLPDLVKDWEEDFSKLFKFIPFDVTSNQSYAEIGKEIENLKGVELIFYLALPPTLFETTIRHLGSLLRKFSNPRKIVIEKPFGFNFLSADRLNNTLYKYFIEDEIYRIDHFLGKGAVQSIFSFRFSNSIFEGIWNKNFVDHVQISALEDIGVEGRAGYYDRIGALRDMVQNHLLQILAFLAMEPPCCLEPERIRDEKIKLLLSIREIRKKDVKSIAVRGRYKGYLQEEGVDPNSKTETFTALKLHIDNLRWQGVPFYLRTGKKLNRKLTEIVIVFKEIPGGFAKLLDCFPQPNVIAFQIAPKNVITLKIQLRPPAQRFISCPVESRLDFDMEEYYHEKIPEAYEMLIKDIIEGDHSLFIRADETLQAWKIVEPILEAWEEDDYIPEYEPGSWGPKEATELIERDGRRWLIV